MDNDNVSVEGQDSETEEYLVDRIISKKFINGIPHYNLQFTGYRQGKYWYPIERLNCNDLINEFEAAQRKRSLDKDPLSSKPSKAPKRKKQFKKKKKKKKKKKIYTDETAHTTQQ